MANEKRLIDANAYPCQNCEVSYCYKNCEKFNAWFKGTVDAVEVVHGRWRRVFDDSAGWVDMCSRCKEFGNGTPYCPNCGAKMDGDGDG